MFFFTHLPEPSKGLNDVNEWNLTPKSARINAILDILSFVLPPDTLLTCPPGDTSSAVGHLDTETRRTLAEKESQTPNYLAKMRPWVFPQTNVTWRAECGEVQL